MRFVHYYEQMLRNGVPPVFSYRLLFVRLKGAPNVELVSALVQRCLRFCDLARKL